MQAWARTQKLGPFLLKLLYFNLEEKTEATMILKRQQTKKAQQHQHIKKGMEELQVEVLKQPPLQMSFAFASQRSEEIAPKMAQPWVTRASHTLFESVDRV